MVWRALGAAEREEGHHEWVQERKGRHAVQGNYCVLSPEDTVLSVHRVHPSLFSSHPQHARARLSRTRRRRQDALGLDQYSRAE